MPCEGADNEALENLHARAQRPIHFGGVQLPALETARSCSDLAVGPTGEHSLEARLIAVSRTALAARIKHGVPMRELVHHVAMLADAEEALLS